MSVPPAARRCSDIAASAALNVLSECAKSAARVQREAFEQGTPADSARHSACACTAACGLAVLDQIAHALPGNPPIARLARRGVGERSSRALRAVLVFGSSGGGSYSPSSHQ
jgi:hypothetical protein